MYFTQIKSYWLNNKFMEKYDLKWSKLRTLGHNSIIKSSYIWLIIVPLAAKMFSALPEVHTFKIFEANITVHFGLPFSWIIFYFMALFFAIGQFIYTVKCPEILKNYENFYDYEKSGSNDLLLLKLLRDICFLGNKHDLSTFIIYTDDFIGGRQIINEKTTEIHNEVETIRAYISYIFIENITIEKQLFYRQNVYNYCFMSFKERHNLSDWFYVISNAYERFDEFWLKASAICFGLGFLLFGYIVCQNICFVIKAIF